MNKPSLAARAPARRLPRSLGLLGDERLARLVGKGNERAFAAIYERYHQRLYRYCSAILHDDQDAQDALQSTLAQGFAALQRGQRDAPLRPWLFRIAHNEAVSVIRRRSGAGELTEVRERGVPSAEEQAGARARLALLVADLQELPDRQRGALVMRELSGLSHEDIAVALGTSVGAAKQSIFEARQALLEFGEGRSMACEEIRRTVSEGDGRSLRGRRVRAHLRDCSACAAFAAAIPSRRADLHALASPLPPILAAGLLARLGLIGSGHGAGGAAGAGGMAAGVAGKAVGASLAAKALAGAVIVATAAGVTGGIELATQDAHPPAVGPPAEATPPVSVPDGGQAGIGARDPGSRGGPRADLPGALLTGAIPSARRSSSGKGSSKNSGAGPAQRGANGRPLGRGHRASAPGRTRSATSRGAKRSGGGQRPRRTTGLAPDARQPSAARGGIAAGGKRKPEKTPAGNAPTAPGARSTPARDTPASRSAEPLTVARGK
jgi:RNA polymerase sigma factor (sigma-70 family)